MVTNWVYELPGRNLSGPAKHVIGGWQLNGQVRPDQISNPELSGPNRKLWFNPAAFQRVTCQIASRPDLCHLGSTGYNTLRGPGERRVDFSMFKNFVITERVQLQFRWFGNPGGISFSNANQITANGSRDGEIRGIRNPMRRMQFGLKLFF